MSRIAIGQCINNWKILRKVENEEKKYTYVYECECIFCGNVREYNKYYLTSSEKITCNKCKNKDTLKNKYELFKTTYDIGTNGELKSFGVIDLDKAYKHICYKGHKFVSSVNKYNGCIKCSNLELVDKNVNSIIKNKKKLEEYIYSNLDDTMSFNRNVEITVPLLRNEYSYKPSFVSDKHKIYIEVVSELDKNFNSNYHLSRSDFTRSIAISKYVKEYYQSNGYLVWTVLCSGNYDTDIEIFNNTSNMVVSILNKQQ